MEEGRDSWVDHYWKGGGEVKVDWGWAEGVTGRNEDSCSEFVEILTYTSAVQPEMSPRQLAMWNKLVEEVRPSGQHWNK